MMTAKEKRRRAEEGKREIDEGKRKGVWTKATDGREVENSEEKGTAKKRRAEGKTDRGEDREEGVEKRGGEDMRATTAMK